MLLVLVYFGCVRVVKEGSVDILDGLNGLNFEEGVKLVINR